MANIIGPTASNDADGLRISRQTDDEALVLEEGEGPADTLRDSTGAPTKSPFIEPCGNIDYEDDQTVAQLAAEQMIVCEASDGELARSLLQYGDITAELKGGLRPEIDNVRYNVRIEWTKGVDTTYWLSTYQIIHMARVIEAAKLWKANGGERRISEQS